MSAIAQPRPGYVYVVSNPSLPGWVKVGHTGRPPHVRAKELSRTSWPTPFELSWARFCWDAPQMERWVHSSLSQVGNRLRELFQVDTAEAVTTLRSAPQIMLPSSLPSAPAFDPDAPGVWRLADPDWGVSFEGLQEQWEWGEEELLDRDPAVRRRGWARHYALSAQGWAEGSRRLGDALLAAAADEGAMRAAWVYEAAEDQGMPGGRLRALWARSQKDAVFLPAFQAEAANWVAHQDRGRPLPSWVQETLLEEQQSWGAHPDRMFDPRSALPCPAPVAVRGPGAGLSR